jgi:hypothetical protein
MVLIPKIHLSRTEEYGDPLVGGSLAQAAWQGG